MRKFLSISLSAVILSCIAFAPASTQQPAAPPAAKDAPPIVAKKEDFSKRPRGHKEPVTHQEKAIRLAKHIDSFARHAPLHKKLRAVALPTSWDSRTQMTNGVSWIPPIVDQGQCGSCWDFSGTTICTTAFLLNQGPNAPGPFSEQYTLDCGQNGGCDGDDNTTVLAWAKATGLPTTAQYGPYQGQVAQCKSNGITLYKIQDWGYCTPANTNAPAAINDIKAAIMTYGSVGSGIDASSSAFSNYTTGVFTVANSSNIDHDIALVGWKDDVTISGGGYWILRNSWSTSWGQAGYMYISYGSAGVGWEGVFAIGPTAPLPVPPAPPTPPTPPVPPLPPLPPAANVTLTVSQALAAGSYQIVAADAVTITGDMTLAQLFVALNSAAKQTPKCKTCSPLTVQPTVQPKAVSTDKRLDDLYDRIVPKMFDSIEANQKSIEVLRNAIAGPPR